MADDLYSREQVEQFTQTVESIALLPRTTFTKRQVVEAMVEPIERALKTRSYDEVAKALVADGLNISAGSLKQYVSKYRRSGKKAKPATGAHKRSAKAKQKGGAESAATKTTSVAVTAKAQKAKPEEKSSSSRRPSRFIEMDEDL